MISQRTWERFGNLLDIRLAKGVFTTEDSIRYTFFAALLEQEKLNPEDVVLEYRHPTIDRAQVDTWIPDMDTGGVALEFKYDRDIPSGKNAPRTYKAGKIFHDLFRLGQISEVPNCLFVYLASSEMTAYFTNSRNGLNEFFDLPINHFLEIDDAFMLGKATTFTSAARKSENVEIQAVYARNLANHHAIRVYIVRRLEDKPVS